MEIVEFTYVSEREYGEIAELMAMLDPELPLTPEKLAEAVGHPSSRLYVLRHEGRVVGCYSLCLSATPTGRKASIEDVVVHEDYRGRHLGGMLIEHALDQLRTLAPIHVQLTSRPHRVAANGMYRSVGFRQKETNVYVLDII